MPKKFLFADLDDTLFQSHKKCPPDTPLTPAAYLKDGSAHSFLTPAQASVLDLFRREMEVIPVTARNADAYARVRLGFASGAVVNYGGVILGPDGAPEAEWLKRSRTLAEQTLPELNAIAARLGEWTAASGARLRIRIIEDFGIPFYVCAKSEEGDETALDPIDAKARTEWSGPGATVAVHRNGNNFSVLPAWLDKRHAVEHLAGRLRAIHGEIVTFGMGDSLSDLAFMSACDYALVPRRSQINHLLGSR